MFLPKEYIYIVYLSNAPEGEKKERLCLTEEEAKNSWQMSQTRFPGAYYAVYKTTGEIHVSKN